MSSRRALRWAIACSWCVALVGCDDCGGLTTQRAIVDARVASSAPERATPRHDAGHDSGARTPPAGPSKSLDRRGAFFDQPDWPLRQHLATEPVVEIERGRGGRSVGFKLRLADGTRAYFKPEQTFSAANWYAEVAAYYLDRELGLGRVPATVGRSFEWEPLRRVYAGDPRVDEVRPQADGTVRGAMIAWVPDRLVPLRAGVGWERWVRVQVWAPVAISPFQRARVYSERLAARASLASSATAQPASAAASEPASAASMEPGPKPEDSPPEPDEPAAPLARAGDPDHPDRGAELSDMILFDYLTANIDRWGGNNVNVLTRGPGGPLVFLDNAAGFFQGRAQNGLIDARLHVVQRFRRRTIDAIRSLDFALLRSRMATDPLAPVLDADRLAGLEQRRDSLLEHVDAMIARFGDAALPW